MELTFVSYGRDHVSPLQRQVLLYQGDMAFDLNCTYKVPHKAVPHQQSSLGLNIWCLDDV